MTKQDWIILRLAKASLNGYIKMSPHGQRDFAKAMVYLTDRLNNDELCEACDQLAEEKAIYETN
jgi:hypothetical protein